MARLQDNEKIIQRMEADLVDKVRVALAINGVDALVAGVFSLDELESKQVNELCGKIGIGVSFLDVTPSEIDTAPKTHGNVPVSTRAKSLDFRFLIITGIPTGSGCAADRHNATDILTMFMMTILGATVDSDTTNRTWDFVKLVPNINESTENMLYYSQVWRVAIPLTGNKLKL